MPRRPLSPLAYARGLVALGRIQFAFEVPLCTLYGSFLGARLLCGHASLAEVHWGVVLQSAFLTWATNVSINYGNEYFDWAYDHIGMREYIARRDAADAAAAEAAGEKPGTLNGKMETETEPLAVVHHATNDKVLPSTTVLIHDGSIAPWTMLLLSALWQASTFAVVWHSRTAHPSPSSSTPPSSSPLSSPSGAYTPSASATTSTPRSPYEGLALHLYVVCTFISQAYAGPPFRLHYRGWGELVSALFLCPVAMVFGMVSYHTAAAPFSSASSVSLSVPALLSHPALGRPVWLLLIGLYLLEQARILVMNIHDAGADAAGGKRTFVVRVGRAAASHMYVGLNVLGVACLGVLLTGTGTGPLAGAGGGRSLGGPRAHTHKGITTGAGAVLALALPVIVITAHSLFAHLRPATAAPARSSSDSVIPVLSAKNLLPLVSLQTLLTPALLSVCLLVFW